MNYVYFDAPAGLSGDMILGALLDLGVTPASFKKKMAELGLPVDIQIKEARRASLRGIKVDIGVKKKSGTRKWRDIESFLKKSPFSVSVKEKASAIFRRLFEAEAKVHGHSSDEAHLHEAGADDALIDILGSCFLAEELKINKFYSSPLNVGQGWVKTSHGILPVPPPAVAELLKNTPVYSAWVKQELVTPTGAAIVSTLVEKFIPFPEISYKRIGCGAGSRNFPRFPNILRAFYGENTSFRKEKRVYTIEANIDDSNPQILGAFFETASKLGALDMSLTPIVMKKNRLASKLTLLAEIDKIEKLIEAIFRETSTIGIRYFPVTRRVLERKTVKVNVYGEKIAIKLAYLGDKEVNIQPEFEDCSKLAKKKNLPLKKVIQLALEEFSKTGKKS